MGKNLRYVQWGIAVFLTGAFWGTVDAGTRAWTTSGPQSLIVRALAVDPAQPLRLYAGTAQLDNTSFTVGGIFRSLDSGWHWGTVNDGVPDLDIDTITFDPRDPRVLYAGTGIGYLLRSTDAGGHWSLIPMGNNGPRGSIWAIAIDPNNGDLFVSTSFVDIFRSTDNGVDWTQYNPYYLSDCVSLAVVPTQPATIYLGGSELERSTDDGNTWVQLYGDQIWSIAADPHQPLTIYISHGRGDAHIDRSTDGGDTWEQVYFAPNTTVECMAISPGPESTFFFSTTQGLYRSEGGGTTVEEISLGFKDVAVLNLVFDPTNPAVIYAGTYGAGIYRSVDGGLNWAAINQGLQEKNEWFDSAISISTSPTDNRSVMVSSGVGGFKSVDRGNHWEPLVLLPRHLTSMSGGLNFAHEGINCILQGKPEGVIYISTGPSKSTDSGRTWTNLSYPGGSTNVIAVDPSNMNVLYDGTSDWGLFKSTDGGASWTSINQGLGNISIWSLAIDPTNPDILFVGTHRGLYKSYNGGQNWTFLGFQTVRTSSLAINPENTQEIYAGEETSLYKSTDGGISWNGAGVYQGWYVVLDLTNPANVLVGTEQNGVFKSTNGGKSWQSMNDGLPNKIIRALAFDPKPPQTIYAGTAAGLYSWSDIPPGDLNLDSLVNELDYSQLASFLSENKGWPADPEKTEADLNHDGAVDCVDLVKLHLLVPH